MSRAVRFFDYDLSERIAQFECVSFDVFDTAILRCIAEPVHAFELLARHYAHLRGLLVTGLDFRASRQNAEEEARRVVWREHQSAEVTLEEIYRALVVPSGWIAEELMALEIELEVTLSRRNEYIHSVYEHALRLGKRVVFASDMYLPHAVIERILRDNGYRDYEKLYVSSSTNRLNKSTGRLYRHMLADLGVPARAVIHIGDNAHSDVLAAARVGVTPFFYERCASRAGRARPAEPWSTTFKPESSVHAGLVHNRLFARRHPGRSSGSSSGSGEDDFWYRFGYETVGLALLGFNRADQTLPEFGSPGPVEEILDLLRAPASPSAKQMKAGAAAFVADAKPLFEFFPWMELSKEVATAPLSRVLERPTREETIRLGELKDSSMPRRLPGSSRTSEVLESIGRDSLGPAFCYYLEKVLERVEALKIDRIGFVAREGFLLQKIHQLLRPVIAKGSTGATSYLHLSRRSTALASVRRFGSRELRLGLGRADNQGITSLFQAFDLYEPEILAHARRVGFDDPTATLSPRGDHPALRRLLDDPEFQQAVSVRAASARDLLRRYLVSQEFFSARRLALVDVGWGGTIQNNLAAAFAGDADCPEIHGLYLGLMHDAWQGPRVPGSERKEGVLADHRQADRLGQVVVFHFVEIFEQSARAPHETTLGYVERDGDVIPIEKEHSADDFAEQRSIAAIAALQRGILDCARGYASSWSGRAAADRPSREQIQRRLERLIFQPTRRELAAIGELTHSDDWRQDSRRSLVSRTGWKALLRPRAWLHQYHRTYWRPGFMAATGGPLFRWAYHVYKRARPTWT